MILQCFGYVSLNGHMDFVSRRFWYCISGILDRISSSRLVFYRGCTVHCNVSKMLLVRLLMQMPNVNSE